MELQIILHIADDNVDTVEDLTRKVRKLISSDAVWEAINERVEDYLDNDLSDPLDLIDDYNQVIGSAVIVEPGGYSD